MTIVATPAYRRPAPAPTPEAITKAAEEDSLARAILSVLAAPLVLLGSTLAELLSRGDDPSAGIDWAALRRRLLRVVRPQLVEEAATGLRRAAGEIGISFDLVPERAVAAAEAHAGALVDGITAVARDAVRAIIARGQREGRTVDQVAAEVREVIGLHPRWANAVANRRRALESAKTPMSATRIDRLVAQYRDRLLDMQARTIARTELLRASNAGAHEGYRLAVESGALPPDVVREWITAPEFKRSGAKDGRICKWCAPMSGRQVVGLDAMYDTPLGPILHPPLHPQCRCVQVIRTNVRRSAA